MKPLIIYHAHCLDGAAAALAAYLKFGENAEYRPAQHGDAPPTDDEVRGRDVYVLDFSYSRVELERIDRHCNARNGETCERGKLVVIDHHKTAAADLEGLPFCIFDMTKSSAVLAWYHFHLSGRTFSEYDKPDEYVPELFHYIQDRDLWRWELPKSREISAALVASGALTDFGKLIPIYRNWDALTAPYGFSIKDGLVLQGRTLVAAEQLMVERIIATAEEVGISHYVDEPNGNRYRAWYFAVAAASVVLPVRGR